jgi:hypothetical protein
LIDLTLEEKEQVIESLKETIPKMTRRQLECLVLRQFGFTMEDSGIILGCTKQNISLHLGNLWDIWDKN